MYGNVLFREESKSNQNNKSAKEKNAVSRLMRDLKEWTKCKDEFPCIEACPLDDNIMEWHCNICPDSGDFKNIIFHLIIIFDSTYPSRAPQVQLCTTIPHPNVFGGWICLDMIKRYDIGRYQGWTAAYSVTSILMQLQSFLFQQKRVDQMGYGSVQRRFDQNRFDSYYLPRIKSFKCRKCGHCWDEPHPVKKSMEDRLKQSENEESDWANTSTSGNKKKNKKRKRRNKKNAKNSNNNEFLFWDGLYHDLEISILQFFSIKDLLKLKRVAKRFQILVFNTKIIQKDGIKCWFHRSATLSRTNGSKRVLCLGYGVTPTYFTNQNNKNPTLLKTQLFGFKNLGESIVDEIGCYQMLPSIHTTFDLLSTDAFDNFHIRKTVFNENTFKHFIPLYLHPKHGEIALKQMDRYIPKLYKGKAKTKVKGGEESCHPWLKLLTIANCMKSLVVSVMEKSNGTKDGKVSLHYSINVLETFFRLHHTLLAIYLTYEKEIGALLQTQINLFFSKNKNGKYVHRNKQNIPDMGVFLAYLTLWKNKNNMKWEDIAWGMLSETFTRQVKWVLNEHKNLAKENSVSLTERAKITFKCAKVSNRLFMFNTFFFKECCHLGEISIKDQFNNYNENFGFPKDESLALKLQRFVKNIQNNVKNYEQFFEIIGIPYLGEAKVGQWLEICLRASAERRYHKPWYYGVYENRYENKPESRIKYNNKSNVSNFIQKQQTHFEKTNEKISRGTSISFKRGITTKVFKWGQQKQQQQQKKANATVMKTTTMVGDDENEDGDGDDDESMEQVNQTPEAQVEQERACGPPAPVAVPVAVPPAARAPVAQEMTPNINVIEDVDHDNVNQTTRGAESYQWDNVQSTSDASPSVQTYVSNSGQMEQQLAAPGQGAISAVPFGAVASSFGGNYPVYYIVNQNGTIQYATPVSLPVSVATTGQNVQQMVFVMNQQYQAPSALVSTSAPLLSHVMQQGSIADMTKMATISEEVSPAASQSEHEDEHYGAPQAAPHAMHGGAKPRRPPIANRRLDWDNIGTNCNNDNDKLAVEKNMDISDHDEASVNFGEERKNGDLVSNSCSIANSMVSSVNTIATRDVKVTTGENAIASVDETNSNEIKKKRHHRARKSKSKSQSKSKRKKNGNNGNKSVKLNDQEKNTNSKKEKEKQEKCNTKDGKRKRNRNRNKKRKRKRSGNEIGEADKTQKQVTKRVCSNGYIHWLKANKINNKNNDSFSRSGNGNGNVLFYLILGGFVLLATIMMILVGFV